MTNALPNFAGLAATVDNPLRADVIELAWEAGDLQTHRKLACRQELPIHLQHQAASHEDTEVRASYASNPAAEPGLLDIVAEGDANNYNIVSALVSNPRTTDSTVESIINAGGWDLAILALQRQGISRTLKAKAGARLAITSDPTTVRASKQLAGLLGSDPLVHEAVLESSPKHALGFVHASLAACGSYVQVQEAFAGWVDKYSNDLVRGDYVQLQAILVDFGSRNSISNQQRRWALGHLHAWKDRVLVEALSSHESGEISILVSSRSTVSNGLEYISHLGGRVPDSYLATLLADAVVTLVGSNQAQMQNAELHVRKIFNPIISYAMLQLEARDNLEAIITLVQLAGIRHVDALEDPWPVINMLGDKLESIAELKVAKLYPRRILETLQPLETLLRLGSTYMEAMLAAIAELDQGSSAWHTAAILAPSWQGNLAQLMHASEKLSTDI